MEEEYNLISAPRLMRLSKPLNYEVSTMLLFFLSFEVPIFIFIAALAALIFTPFMLYTLYKENKKGWIIFFVILVVVPFIVLTVISIYASSFTPIILITLALFYLYCFLLRHELNGWIKDIRAKNQYIIEKHKRDQQLNDFMKNFE